MLTQVSESAGQFERLMLSKEKFLAILGQLKPRGRPDGHMPLAFAGLKGVLTTGRTGL